MADMGLQIGFSHSTSRVHFTPVHTFKYFPDTFGVSPVAQSVKNLPTMQETVSDPWIGKIPCRRKWQSVPVFLPGESHAQGSLVGYSPQGHKELDTTNTHVTRTKAAISSQGDGSGEPIG